MRHLLANRRQTGKVRLVLWGSWVAAAACLWWGWDLLHTYGLHPGDGGELRALPVRLRMAVIIGLMGVVPAGALTLFARRYVVELALDRTHLRITTLGWGAGRGRIHEVSRSDLLGSRHFHGRMNTGRSLVHAPWVTLRTRGRHIPFVLDLQAESLDLGPLAPLLAPDASGASASPDPALRNHAPTDSPGPERPGPGTHAGGFTP